MATNSYIQVPPDGSGKKLFARQHTIGADTVQTQAFHLSDPTDPTRIQHVDIQGQASVRFAEGSPSMDAFGNLRTTDADFIAGYEWSNGTMDDLFSDKSTTGGTISSNPTASTLVLSCNTAATASISRTSDRYHYYLPGTGNLIIQTLYLSDSGRTNNTRRWGYYNTNNGLYWELAETTLNVVIRSNTSGSIVETKVPRSSWNGDKLDGTGPSGMILDLTKANFYWIDYAWLGVGAVRFGILGEDGARWVVHTFKNPNANTGPYMQSGSQPVKFENFNTGLTAGTSDLNMICTAIYAESTYAPTVWTFSDIETATPKTVTTNTPVVSIRPKLLLNGKANRVGIYIDSLSFYITGGGVKLSILEYPDVLTGETWSITGAESAEGDVAATAATGGTLVHTVYAGPGAFNWELGSLYDLHDVGLCLSADGTIQYPISIIATKMDGTTVTVSATINYRELR